MIVSSQHRQLQISHVARRTRQIANHFILIIFLHPGPCAALLRYPNSPDDRPAFRASFAGATRACGRAKFSASLETLDTLDAFHVCLQFFQSLLQAANYLNPPSIALPAVLASDRTFLRSTRNLVRPHQNRLTTVFSLPVHRMRFGD